MKLGLRLGAAIGEPAATAPPATVKSASRRFISPQHSGKALDRSHQNRYSPAVLRLVCLLLACVSTLLAQDRPVYELTRAAGAIRVDGRLDDAAWAKAAAVGPFVNSRDGASSPLRTEAKLLYDDQFLYFAFRVVDENIWATMRQRDDHLWEEEVVEVFLQADPRQTSYIELEVNPLGTMIDIFLLGIRKPIPYRSWNSARLQWGVQVDGTVDGKPGDREWTCEIALPLEDVVPAPNSPPKPGDRWRLNLYRVEKLPARASLAWSPTLNSDFHTPSRFGEIVFK